ncbi:hypothetical protein EIP91_007004 [Steccherinum ochraceum]|uniref:DH domain-containing protein n=1 Tax=Steccherinum ochraceum TaxID=92696 RepID=A0A4R0RQW7_9APHY|nr:hypothetical protein EIP91_007004 [Steccherinum ochraceum]
MDPPLESSSVTSEPRSRRVGPPSDFQLPLPSSSTAASFDGPSLVSLPLPSPPLPPRSPLRPQARGSTDPVSTPPRTPPARADTADTTLSSLSSTVVDILSDIDDEMTLLHSRSFNSFSDILDTSSLARTLRSKTPEKPLPPMPPSPISINCVDAQDVDVPCRSRPSSILDSPAPISKRVHALQELLSSERAYASDLILIRDIHIPLALGQPTAFQATSLPLTPPHSSGSSARTVSTASDSSGGSILGSAMTKEDTRIIFNNVAELASFSDTFSTRIEEALGDVLEDGEGEDHIGKLFLAIIPDLEPLYNTYITKHPQALEHLNSLPQSPALTAYLAHSRTLAQSLTHAWDLPSLLIKPVQRLLKYSLLLGAIIDETPDSHGDKKALKEARAKMEAVAHGVNEGRRRREVVKEVLTGTPARKMGDPKAKKKGLNLGVAASVNLGRMKSIRTGALKAKESVDANQEATSIDEWGHRLKESVHFLRRFARDATGWAETMSVQMKQLQQWTIGFGDVLGLSEDQGSDAFDAFLGVIREKLIPICDELSEIISTRLLVELSRLRDISAAPERLLEAMKTLEPYHYGLLNVNISKSRPSPQLLEASQSYVAIRAQLYAELPDFLKLLEKGIRACIIRFAGWQAEFYYEVRERWGELWDALKVDGEMQGASSETLRVWWSRYAEVEAHVKALNITRPAQRPDQGSPEEKLKAKPGKGRKRSMSNSIDTLSALSLADPSVANLRASTSTTDSYVVDYPEAAPAAENGWGSGHFEPLDRRKSNESLHSRKSIKSHRHTHSAVSHLVNDDELLYGPPRASPKGRKEISHPQPLKKSASHGRLLDENSSASSSLRSLHDGEEDDHRGRPSRKPSLRRRLTDTLRPSPGPPSINTRHRRSPSLPNNATQPLPSPTPSQLSFNPPTIGRSRNRSPARILAMYQCQVIFNCTPPPDVSYHDLPFFTLRVGEVYDVLQEQGHPSTHPHLPLYVDDGEDCLLLVRNSVEDIGWALASFLLPVD